MGFLSWADTPNVSPTLRVSFKLVIVTGAWIEYLFSSIFKPKILQPYRAQHHATQNKGKSLFHDIIKITLSACNGSTHVEHN